MESLRIQLLVDRTCDPEQLSFVGLARQSVAELAIDPVKDADPALLRIAKCRFFTVAGASADVKRQSLSAIRLKHELSDRTLLARQQTAAYELIADLPEMRDLHGSTQAFREPSNQMRLLIGADFNRVPDLGRVNDVRDGGPTRKGQTIRGFGDVVRMRVPACNAAGN